MRWVTRWRDVWHRFSGRGAYPHELAFLLNLPVRRWLQSPESLVARLGLRADARVLELGPGPGYFSRELAHALPRGRLVLVDLQREMLAKARRRLRAARTANAALVQAEGARLPFRSGSFDVAFLVAVLGEVPDPAACARGLRSVLRPGGLLSVTETRGDPDALSADALDALARAAGLHPTERFAERAGFTAHFRRPGKGDAA